MEKVVKDTIKIFEGIPLRESSNDPNDLPEALSVIVVNYDGVNPATLITGEGGPSLTSPTHYDNFTLGGWLRNMRIAFVGNFHRRFMPK